MGFRPSLAPSKASADMLAGKELGCSPHTSSWRAEGAEVTFWPEWLVPIAAKLVTVAEKQHSSVIAGDWKPLLLGRNQCPQTHELASPYSPHAHFGPS